MSSGYRLKKTNKGFEFYDEAILEDFVWYNLYQLFGLYPFQRQYYIQGQYCDILGIDKNRSLVVIELKNVEDRYIVQQLTRYYDALLEEKPFSEQVEYKNQVALIAIAPSFHKDNFIDIKYHTLDFRFFQFGISFERNNYTFTILDTHSTTSNHLKIDPVETGSDLNVPSPPKVLLNFLSQSVDVEVRDKILQLRYKILSFDERMQEASSSSCITFGKGKNKPCAELRFDRKKEEIVLFLWLPLHNQYRGQIGRTKIWTDWKQVYNVAHVTKGVGNIKTYQEWKKSQESSNATGRGYLRKVKYPKVIAAEIEVYQKLIDYKKKKYPLENLDYLVDFALDHWLERL